MLFRSIAEFVLYTSARVNRFEEKAGFSAALDLVDGATVTLKSVMQESDSDVIVSFANDTTSIKSKIESFVTKFNDIYSFIKSKSGITSSTDRGIFIGDSNASSLLQTFTFLAYSSVTGISETEINNLSKIGITFNSTSGLTISDSSELENAISETPDQVASLFNSTNGIAVSLYNKVTSYIGIDGYLTRAKNSVDRFVTNLSDSVTKAQTLIDKEADSMRSRYQQLQTQLSTLLSMQSFLFGG